MAYRFQTSPVASVKISQWRGTDGNTLTLPNINGALSSADSLIAGIQQFLSIPGLQNQFSPIKVSRVVSESVIST